MPTAIIYTRVSTAEQVKSGLGLEAQLDTCMTHAAARGWTVAGTYTDAGVSGSTPLRERPEGARASAHAKEVGGIVLVARMDRIGRDALDRLTVLRDAANEGWRIESPDMAHVDPSTPEGQLMHNIMAGIAEYEKEVIRLRTKAAIRAKIRRGESVGRRPEVEPAAIERARVLHREGFTYIEIAVLLDDEGFAPPRAKKWHRKTVSHMVTGQAWGSVTREIRGAA